MNSPRFGRRIGAILVSAVIAVATLTACSGSAPPSGLGTQQLSVSSDTVVGSGQLAELQQRRAAWVARGIDNYTVELRITCFCIEEVRRPVLVEVRSGAVSKVLDLETAKPVADVSRYPSITQLFDRAIEMRSGGGNVSVAYDKALGYPARLEVGTIANDAGTVFHLGTFTTLGS
jgi:hypothetical protein